MRRLRLRLRQIGIVALVERDAVASDVHEEVATFGESRVHFLQSVDDEVDRRPQRLGDRELAVKPVLGRGPELDTVGQLLMVDDDEQVEVGLVSLGGVRLVDPAAARIASVEDDLEDRKSVVSGKSGSV